MASSPPDYRGKLRLLIMHVLEEGPKHGYAIMKELEKLIGHSPGAGAVYPQLRYLWSKGYVVFKEGVREGKKVKEYALTRKGVEYLDSRAEELQHVLKLLEGFRELKDLGQKRIWESFKELLEIMPYLPDEGKAQVREAIDSFVSEINRIILEYRRRKR